ncbi:MAG TPA: hypothetical protein VFI15_04305 [Candidatus Limnocylindrales bacterium]|nr:hypothetical protein [Candidatus Limnocylindrales bacterium]
MLNEQYLRAAQRDREREIRKRIRVRRAQRAMPQPSVRRAIGRSIVEIGSRIAAEPQPRLARSR